MSVIIIIILIIIYRFFSTHVSHVLKERIKYIRKKAYMNNTCITCVTYEKNNVTNMCMYTHIFTLANILPYKTLFAESTVIPA